jgi:hypothetical protein
MLYWVTNKSITHLHWESNRCYTGSESEAASFTRSACRWRPVLSKTRSSFHWADSHLSEAHSKPSITIHGLAEVPQEHALFQASATDTAGWIHQSSGWSALAGGGCAQVHTCHPKLQ